MRYNGESQNEIKYERDEREEKRLREIKKKKALN